MAVVYNFGAPQAAGSLHGLHVLQRFALTALAEISMSPRGRRLLLIDATPVPPLTDVLTGGEQHAAALAALVPGTLALEAAALGTLQALIAA
jgi:hypothetical protein